LYLKTTGSGFNNLTQIEGQLWFRYEKIEMPAHCHRSDKRLTVISCHQQTKDGVVIIRLSTPNDNFETAALPQIQKRVGIHFDFKRSIFKIEFASLHQLIASLLESVIEIGESVSTWEVWAENLKVKLLNHYHMVIRSLDIGFKLEFQDSHSAHRIESWQLIHILKKKSAFVKLDDGCLGVLPQAWISELLRIYQNINPDGHFDSAGLFHFFQSEDEFSFDIRGDENYSKIKNKLDSYLSEDGPSPLNPSDHFNGVLFDYQSQGLGWLVFLDEFNLGGLLADDMGLGKTIQVLAFLDYIKFEKTKQKVHEHPSLLIAPKSVLEQWVANAHEFTPHLKVQILKPKDLENILTENYQVNRDILSSDLLITSYGILRRYIKHLQKMNFERVILDEAQIIKNERSLVSIAAKSLKCNKRLALSGTPIENHIADFFSLFQFLNPGMFPLSLLTSENDDELKKFFKKIKPLVLYRKKENVLIQLPKKTENIILLPLNYEQREIYEKIKSYYSVKLASLDEVNQFNEYKVFFLEGLLRLRQICCDPHTVYSSLETNQKLNSSKTDYMLKEFIKFNNSESKVVVFSQFTSFLKILRTYLEVHGIPFAYLDGQTQNRKEIIENFQTQANLKIFLIGLKSGGLGLNLTAANYCYILEPWWNPAVEAQAVDRIHRIGQVRDIFVNRLIAKDTVEEKICELQELKFKHAQLLEISDRDFLNSLNLQDYKNLFS
jgi:SNF2 family DNA or RNA helicase